MNPIIRSERKAPLRLIERIGLASIRLGAIRPDPRGEPLADTWSLGYVKVGIALSGGATVHMLAREVGGGPEWWLPMVLCLSLLGYAEVARRRDLRSVWLKDGELTVSDPDGDFFVSLANVVSIKDTAAPVLGGRIITLGLRGSRVEKVSFFTTN